MNRKKIFTRLGTEFCVCGSVQVIDGIRTHKKKLMVTITLKRVLCVKKNSYMIYADDLQNTVFCWLNAHDHSREKNNCEWWEIIGTEFIWNRYDTHQKCSEKSPTNNSCFFFLFRETLTTITTKHLTKVAIQFYQSVLANDDGSSLLTLSMISSNNSWYSAWERTINKQHVRLARITLPKSSFDGTKTYGMFASSKKRNGKMFVFILELQCKKGINNYHTQRAYDCRYQWVKHYRQTQQDLFPHDGYIFVFHVNLTGYNSFAW